MRKSYAKALVTERTGRDLDELLRELYIEKRHTLTEIGAALQVNRETVRQWIVEAGISRDDRPAVSL